MIAEAAFRAFSWRRKKAEQKSAQGKQSSPQNVPVQGSRSVSGGHVLVIDHAIPAFDKGAGDRNVFEFMKTLRAAGNQVTFWPYSPDANVEYLDQLCQLGVRAVTGKQRGTFAAWAAQEANKIDTVMLCRPHVARDYLFAARALGCPIIYYGHDLHFARFEGQAATQDDLFIRARAWSMRLLETSIWRQVEVVAYPTSEEVEKVRKISPNANCLQLQIFCFDHFPTKQVANTSSNMLFVGNFAHAPNVDAVIWFTERVMPAILEEVPEARLKVVGGNAPEKITSMQHPNVDVVGWVDDSSLDYLYDQSRVVVVPLRFGAGLKLKSVEAMVRGVPLVTTTIGAQGIPAALLSPSDTEPELAANVVRVLLSGEQEWIEQVQRQLRFCEDHYSRKGMLEHLQAAFRQAHNAPSRDVSRLTGFQRPSDTPSNSP